MLITRVLQIEMSVIAREYVPTEVCTDRGLCLRIPTVFATSHKQNRKWRPIMASELGATSRLIGQQAQPGPYRLRQARHHEVVGLLDQILDGHRLAIGAQIDRDPVALVHVVAG